MTSELCLEEPRKSKPKKFNLGCDVDREEIFTYPYLTDDETIAYIKKHGNVMIIIRGPNSTLKATLSEMIIEYYPTAQHFCADHYFSKTFSPPERSRETIKLSHVYCEKKVEAACRDKKSPIIVQNTHMRKFELQKYLDLAAVYNYTVIMAITLYKFNVTPEALGAINPDGLNVNYFRNRLRQWEDLPPVFTGWFLCPDDCAYVLKILQTSLPALLNDGKFCRAFDLYDNEDLWSYFVAKRNLYCIAGYSFDKNSMKQYYLSDMVQECYGKSYTITIVGYLVNEMSIMGIVHVDEDMLKLVFKEKKDNSNTLSACLSSLDLCIDEYKSTIPIDFENSDKNKTVLHEDWLDESIDTKTCRLIHLAQKKFKPFNIREVEEKSLDAVRSLKEHLSYTELEGGIFTSRLPNDMWLVKLPKKLRVSTVFTGLYV